MRTQFQTSFEEIVSMDNLLEAWQEFIKGKRSKHDVQTFGLHLMDNLAELHHDLMQESYQHGSYYAFSISDPKPRSIHKASVRDRVLHRAIYHKLYPFFDRAFIPDSYSCRLERGTHKAMQRFQSMVYQVTQNGTKTGWILKCDIRKFFASIDQHILLYILSIYIPDQKTLWLLKQIVSSFHSTAPGKGLPLGNLTSQLLVNVYMNEFDKYVKHRLKVKCYTRYADDFVLLSDDRKWLEEQIEPMKKFLWHCLQLSLHPQKISMHTAVSGVDFLGWVNFPTHRVLRTTTKKRMEKRIQENPEPATLASYLGVMSHGNTERLRAEVPNSYGLWRSEEESKLNV